MSTCPVCTAEQPEGLLCHSCTTVLEKVLAEIPWLVGELTTTISKQAKIGIQSGKGAPAHERNPINYGALTVADELGNTLTTWARDIGMAGNITGSATSAAARYLLGHIADVRKHTAVSEMVDEITDASHRARQMVDRPADKQFVGPCLAETPDDDGRAITCLDDIWAATDAHEATCRTCGITHDVAERRLWMLREAEDRLFTVREAAQLIGSYGQFIVSESTVRGYVKRGWIIYHGKVEGSSVIRLGDLLDIIKDPDRRKAGRKLRTVQAA